MIDLKQLSVDLSFKINDPVSDSVTDKGDAYSRDGKLFTSVDRLRFINQGISKLYMYLLNLQRDYRPKFVDVNLAKELNLAVNDGNIYLDANVEAKQLNGSWGIETLYFKEIKEIFVTYQTSELASGEVKVRAEKIENDIYASVYHGNNTQYKPSFKEKKIYWTLLGNVIHLLPKSSNTNIEYYKEMMLVYSPDISNLTYDSGNYITQDYYLMLLILSALEAMVDMNNQAKFQLLTAELTSLFQLLGQVTQLEESKDGK